MDGVVTGLAGKTRKAGTRMVEKHLVKASMKSHAVEGLLMSGSRSSNPPDPKVSKGPRVALEALLTGTAADPIRRALWLDALDQRLRPALPLSLAAHARLANVNGTQLVFLVDSPVWRARLRLAAPELLDAARSVGLDASEVVVKITTRPLQPKVSEPRPVLPMSVAAREGLQAALASLSEPEKTLPKPKGDVS